MALLAVIITTVALCISGLYIGAHIAIVSEPFTPSLPYTFCRKVLDRVAVVLAWGCWLGAIFLAIWPPDKHDGPPEIWRGRAIFALVFGPLGCLGRFYASLYLNGKNASFPLGTFVVNVFGTAILGMSYDLQRVPLGGVVGCQVLQGIEDGMRMFDDRQHVGQRIELAAKAECLQIRGCQRDYSAMLLDCHYGEYAVDNRLLEVAMYTLRGLRRHLPAANNE